VQQVPELQIKMGASPRNHHLPASSGKSEVEDPVSGDNLGTPDQRAYRAQTSL
jgi:hypothetical protein